MHTETAAKSIELPRWAATDWRLTVTHYRLLCRIAAYGDPWLPVSHYEAGKIAGTQSHIARRALENLVTWDFLLRSGDGMHGPMLYRVRGV